MAEKGVIGRIVFVLFLFLSGFFSSAQVSDGFEDLDFTANPRWYGDTGQFIVNSSHLLQLKSTVADTSVLVTANSLSVRAEWTFWAKLSFNTSGNNFARVYLVSDRQDLKGPVHGYFLQLGGKGDSLTFCRQEAFSFFVLCNGVHASFSGTVNQYRFRVLHDSAGFWRVFSDSTGGGSYKEECVVWDTSFKTTSWSGVYCKYTASNSTRFYFDDFYIGEIRVDTVAPRVLSAVVSASDELTLRFSEAVDGAYAQSASHYSTGYNGGPEAVVYDFEDPACLRLRFSRNFLNDLPDTLVLSDITDLSGNHSGEIRVLFCRHVEKAYDVVISEIMADPDPVVGLPEVEYVELYNRTRFPVQLSGWTFQFGAHRKELPETVIDPDGYLLLTHGDSLEGYGRCADILSYSLSNEGEELVLKNEQGKVIHAVCYSKEWYGDEMKEGGGWSLEMKDPGNPCACRENWRASISEAGGTPGAINSAHSGNPDNFPPHLRRCVMVSEHQVNLYFSEAMDSLSLDELAQWSVNQGKEHPDRLVFYPPRFDCLGLWYPEPFSPGVLYSVSGGLVSADCAENKTDTSVQVRVGLPDSVDRGDIIINELLTDPETGGKRFVELLNRSLKIVSLQGLYLASLDTLSGEIIQGGEICASPYLLFPGGYLVVSEDSADVQKRYFSPDKEAFLNVPTFPTFDHDAGIAAILREYDGLILDEVKYLKEMQSPFLSTTSGVSLERVSPEVSSGERTNWHSASGGCGYATPGYRNSVYYEPGEGEMSEWVQPTPVLFTPGDDGKDDFQTIIFYPDLPGYSVRISVFDRFGREVKQIADNRLLSPGDRITWDGTDESGSRLATGIYILVASFIHPEGTRKSVKKAIVIGGDF